MDNVKIKNGLVKAQTRKAWMEQNVNLGKGGQAKSRLEKNMKCVKHCVKHKYVKR